jgi:hypothetical protein
MFFENFCRLFGFYPYLEKMYQIKDLAKTVLLYIKREISPKIYIFTDFYINGIQVELP